MDFEDYVAAARRPDPGGPRGRARRTSPTRCASSSARAPASSPARCSTSPAARARDGVLTGVRFIFRPPAEHAAGLLTLPWDVPLADWVDDRLLEVAHRGISRHVVRFVEVDGMVFALKEIDERLARREYHLLGSLGAMGMPAVSVLGICVERTPHRGARAGRDPRHPVPRLRHVLPLRVLPPARRAAPPTSSSTPWSSCWCGCTSRACTGATARSPTRCSAPTRAPSRPTSWTPRRPSCTPRCRTASATATSTTPPNASAASCSTCRTAACCPPTSTRSRSPTSCPSATTRCGTS